MNEYSVPVDEFDAAAEIIYEALRPSAEITWPLLSQRCGTEVWVKHENHLPTGAFKVRGGLVFARHLAQSGETGGVIAATRGNHGQSVAYAAARYGIDAVIIVPVGNNPDKNRAMRAYGAELIEHGRDFDAAYAHAIALAAERSLTLFPSFDPILIRGVGTYAMELFRAVAELDTVYAPIGLGSGICGLIAARDALGLATKIVGVVSENADTYARSFAARKALPTASANTMADGLAVRTPNDVALSILLAGADRIVSVSDEAVMEAMSCYFSDTHNLAEGAGAAPLAALLQERDRYTGERVGLILSGSNIDRESFARILQRP